MAGRAPRVRIPCTPPADANMWRSGKLARLGHGARRSGHPRAPSVECRRPPKTQTPWSGEPTVSGTAAPARPCGQGPHDPSSSRRRRPCSRSRSRFDGAPTINLSSCAFRLPGVVRSIASECVAARIAFVSSSASCVQRYCRSTLPSKIAAPVPPIPSIAVWRSGPESPSRSSP